MRAHAPATPRVTRRTRPRAVALSLPAIGVATWMCVLLFTCFVYFLPRWHDWNQDARLDMSMAIVNHGTVAIDAYHRNTSDDDFYAGHYYSNKAPGQSLIGTPVYAAYKLVLATSPGRAAANAIERNSAWNLALADAAGRFVPPKLDFALLQYVESIVTVAVPAVLLLLLFYWFLGYFSASAVHRAVVTLSLGLGTIIFPYAQLFYSHVPAAALLFCGFVLVFVLQHPDGERGSGTAWFRRHPTITAALAGLALGGACVFEYPALLVAALIGVYAIARLPRALLVPLVAAAVPPLAVVMAYDYAAYHNPFVTGYSGHETLWKQENQGIGGFTWPPKLVALKGMSYDRYRGLFFLSPFLVLAFPGYVLGARLHRGTMVLLFTIPVCLFLAVSMYWGWYAGQVVGPRYIIPMLPFLAVPIVFVLDRLAGWAAGLGVAALVAMSIFNVWAETLGGQGYPHGYTSDPLFTYSLPNLARADVPMNLGMFFGLRGLASLLPLGIFVCIWIFSAALRGLPGRFAHRRAF